MCRDDTRGPCHGWPRFGYAAASFMSGKPRIYIAGPLGFSEAGRHFYASVLVPFVSGLGYDVADPWTLTDARKIEAVQAMPQGPDRRDAWRQLNEEIGANNREDRRRAGPRRHPRRRRRRQRHRRGDRLCVRARKADRRLPGGLPRERRQRGRRHQPAGRVLHPPERRDDREPLRGPRAEPPVPAPRRFVTDPFNTQALARWRAR